MRRGSRRRGHVPDKKWLGWHSKTAELKACSRSIETIERQASVTEIREQFEDESETP